MLNIKWHFIRHSDTQTLEAKKNKMHWDTWVCMAGRLTDRESWNVCIFIYLVFHRMDRSYPPCSIFLFDFCLRNMKIGRTPKGVRPMLWGIFSARGYGLSHRSLRSRRTFSLSTDQFPLFSFAKCSDRESTERSSRSILESPAKWWARW